MVEEQVDVENISPHGYTRNTPSDTEVHAEHQLRADKSTCQEEENIQNHAKLSRIKKLEGGKECQQDWTCPQQMGELKQGSNPHIRQLSESEKKHFRLGVKQLICGSLNGMRIRQSLLQPCIPRIGTLVPWKEQQLGAGVQGLWSNPRARTAIDCGETD